MNKRLYNQNIKGKEKLKKSIGFTLIELLLAIALVSILTILFYPNYIKTLQKSKRTEAFNTLLNTQNKLERYYTENDHYPESILEISDPPPTSNDLTLAKNLNYRYSYIRLKPNHYVLTAIAITKEQAKDKGCTELKIDSLNQKMPVECWIHP